MQCATLKGNEKWNKDKKMKYEKKETENKKQNENKTKTLSHLEQFKSKFVVL